MTLYDSSAPSSPSSHPNIYQCTIKREDLEKLRQISNKDEDSKKRFSVTQSTTDSIAAFLNKFDKLQQQQLYDALIKSSEQLPSIISIPLKQFMQSIQLKCTEYGIQSIEDVKKLLWRIKYQIKSKPHLLISSATTTAVIAVLTGYAGRRTW